MKMVKLIIAIVAAVTMPALSGTTFAETDKAKEVPVVLTVLYNAPTDPAKFDSYYSSHHLPLAAKIKGVDRVVLIKTVPGADGAKPSYYRMAQLFFHDADQMAKSMGSPEGQAVVADLPNFADGGVVVLTGTAN